MCIHTHAYLSMHHLDIHIKVHTNSKSNIPIQAYMDITSHYHPGNDTHRSLGLVVTQFVHDQPPTSLVMASILYNYVSFICHTMTHEPLNHVIHFLVITHKMAQISDPYKTGHLLIPSRFITENCDTKTHHKTRRHQSREQNQTSTQSKIA